MKKTFWIGALVVLLIARTVLAEDFPSAQFKGYAAVDQAIKERVLREGQPFHIGTYLGDSVEIYPFDNALRDLLGTYNGNDLNSGFHNGQSNPVNLLLWHVAFSGLADDISSVCTHDAASDTFAANVSPGFAYALKPLCAWPADGARAESALLGFWLALMSFDAPMSEYEAWRDFFLGPVFRQAEARKTISAMALALLDNPHFLLRK